MTHKTMEDWMRCEVSGEDLDALKELVARYPYAGPLRMMLAKAADRAGDLERRELLLRAGAHVSSRSAMLAYFMGPALVEEAQAVHAEVERMEEVTEQDLVELVWHDQTSDSTEEESPAPDPAQESPDPLPRDNMVTAIASVIESEVSAWVQEDESAATAEHEGVEVPGLALEAAPQSLFGLWLKQRAQETGFGGQREVEQGAAALIDAFLAKGDVRLGPVRDTLQTTEDWAKQGLVEDPSLVTETMAKLYAAQGQMGRARKAYKLLALKYPEKSVYFAAQLRKLRNS
jgi:hypothetical protein